MRAAARAQVRRWEVGGLPPPSVVVAGGHGVHLYWLLSEPYLIVDAGDPPPVRWEWVRAPDGRKRRRNDVELPGGERVYEFHADPATGLDSGRKHHEFPDRLSPKALKAQNVVQGLAKKVDGDHTKDLSRRLRLPGALNRKDERNGQEPVPCRLVLCDPARRRPFSAFEPFAAFSPDRLRAEALAKIVLPRTRLTRGGCTAWPGSSAPAPWRRTAAGPTGGCAASRSAAAWTRRRCGPGCPRSASSRSAAASTSTGPGTRPGAGSGPGSMSGSAGRPRAGSRGRTARRVGAATARASRWTRSPRGTCADS